MYIPKKFSLKEVYSKEDYNNGTATKLGWRPFNEDLLRVLDIIRLDIVKAPMLINNWAFGGSNNYGGLRTDTCPFDNRTSIHFFGGAVDLKVKDYYKYETKDRIKIYNDLRYKILERDDININEVEWDIPWLHIGKTNNDALREYNNKGRLIKRYNRR